MKKSTKRERLVWLGWLLVGIGAAALAVAIPCYLAYNYLIARVNLITLDMEKASLEMLGFIERRRREGGAAEAKHE